jgi:hypothetical protein
MSAVTALLHGFCREASRQMTQALRRCGMGKNRELTCNVSFDDARIRSEALVQAAFSDLADVLAETDALTTSCFSK